VNLYGQIYTGPLSFGDSLSLSLALCTMTVLCVAGIDSTAVSFSTLVSTKLSGVSRLSAECKTRLVGVVGRRPKF